MARPVRISAPAASVRHLQHLRDVALVRDRTGVAAHRHVLHGAIRDGIELICVAGQRLCCPGVWPRLNLIGFAVWSARASERSQWVEWVTWGARMEWAEQQKGRADHMQPGEQDLADKVLSAVHGDLSRSWPSSITSGAALIPHSGQCSSLRAQRDPASGLPLEMAAPRRGRRQSPTAPRCGRPNSMARSDEVSRDEVERILIYPPPLAAVFCLWTASGR